MPLNEPFGAEVNLSNIAATAHGRDHRRVSSSPILSEVSTRDFFGGHAAVGEGG